MSPTVVLFDVDGTLVHTGGAGRRAMSRAFDAVCGVAGALDDVPLGGMTDRLIVRTGLQAAGLDEEEGVIDRVLEVYLEHLPELVAVSDGYRTLPGVHDAVRAAAAREGFAVGLGTGNIEDGARVKLARGQLDAAFDFGGFGSDAEDRVELLRVGALRGAARLGRPMDQCRLVIVGDTPRDVHAALALGAECVAVGTGGHAAPDLRDLGATGAFDDLTTQGALAAILG